MSETIPIEDYVNAIDRTLENGTHRAGTMRTISLVGCMQVRGPSPPPGAALAARPSRSPRPFSPALPAALPALHPRRAPQEEKGGYFGEVISALQKSVWLRDVLPWGSESRYHDLEPAESDDGPIMWACPGQSAWTVGWTRWKRSADTFAWLSSRAPAGEQVVPLQELGDAKRTQDAVPVRRKRNDLEMLQVRETLLAPDHSHGPSACSDPHAVWACAVTRCCHGTSGHAKSSWRTARAATPTCPACTLSATPLRPSASCRAWAASTTLRTSSPSMPATWTASPKSAAYTFKRYNGVAHSARGHRVQRGLVSVRFPRPHKATELGPRRERSLLCPPPPPDLACF